MIESLLTAPQYQAELGSECGPLPPVGGAVGEWEEQVTAVRWPPGSHWHSVSRWWGFPGSVVKNPPAMQKTQVRSLGQEDPLEKEMTTCSSIFA